MERYFGGAWMVVYGRIAGCLNWKFGWVDGRFIFGIWSIERILVGNIFRNGLARIWTDFLGFGGF